MAYIYIYIYIYEIYTWHTHGIHTEYTVHTHPHVECTGDTHGTDITLEWDDMRVTYMLQTSDMQTTLGQHIDAVFYGSPG